MTSGDTVAAVARDTYSEALQARELLQGWMDGDVDVFADSLEDIADPGEELIAELTESEGDARGNRFEIEAELRRLAGITRGALYLLRKSVDLTLDPPAERFASREAVIEYLLNGPPPS